MIMKNRCVSNLSVPRLYTGQDPPPPPLGGIGLTVAYNNVKKRTFLPSGPKPWFLLGAWAILASLDFGFGKGISGFRLVSRSNSPVSVRNGDSDIVLDKDKVEVLVVVVVADICAMYYCYYVWLYVRTTVVLEPKWKRYISVAVC